MPETLYFAYGSNLCLQQMGQRCPSSSFVGRAVLIDYRWQINERGFANVVVCPGSNVHGLVFKVPDAIDRARLDASEGVSFGAYSKAYLNVILYPAPHKLQTRTDNVLAALNAYLDGRPSSPRRPVVQERTLVYLSTDYTTDGPPRAEYIRRINAGIRDSVALGIPSDFFDNAVRSIVPAEAPPTAPIPG